MLSGRYRTELLCSHWSDNPNGWCLTPYCLGNNAQEDLDHILSACPSLNHTRRNLQLFTMNFAQLNPILKPIINTYCNPKYPLFCQFILDCSMLPELLVLTNLYGPTLLHKLLYLGCTWCYALHRDRARLLNRWSFS